MRESKSITRRDFLKGAGAVAAGAAVMGVLGGCATNAAAAEAAQPTPMPEPSPTPNAPIVPAAGPSSYEGGARVLAFASDQHAETPGFAGWLADQKAVYGEDLEYLTYGGDICDKSWDQSVFDGFKAALDEAMPGKYFVTTGNQEHKSGAPAWDSLGEGFIRLGEAARTEDYIIYCFGAAQEAMIFPQADIDALAAYLSDAPRDIPIFVVSHFPLHLSIPYTGHDIPGGYRQTQGNDKGVEVRMYYVDTNIPMLTKESAVITIAPDGTVSADVVTSDSTDYVDMFYLAGWYEDPSFAEDY